MIELTSELVEAARDLSAAITKAQQLLAMIAGVGSPDELAADWAADSVAEQRLCQAHERLRVAQAAQTVVVSGGAEYTEPPIGYDHGVPVWLKKCAICQEGMLVGGPEDGWIDQRCAWHRGWDGVTALHSITFRVAGVEPAR